MLHATFKELLDANLSCLRTRVLADHEREVTRLKGKRQIAQARQRSKEKVAQRNSPVDEMSVDELEQIVDGSGNQAAGDAPSRRGPGSCGSIPESMVLESMEASPLANRRAGQPQRRVSMMASLDSSMLFERTANMPPLTDGLMPESMAGTDKRLSAFSPKSSMPPTASGPDSSPSWNPGAIAKRLQSEMKDAWFGGPPSSQRPSQTTRRSSMFGGRGSFAGSFSKAEGGGELRTSQLANKKSSLLSVSEEIETIRPMEVAAQVSPLKLDLTEVDIEALKAFKDEEKAEPSAVLPQSDAGHTEARPSSRDSGQSRASRERRRSFEEDLSELNVPECKSGQASMNASIFGNSEGSMTSEDWRGPHFKVSNAWHIPKRRTNRSDIKRANTTMFDSTSTNSTGYGSDDTDGGGRQSWLSNSLETFHIHEVSIQTILRSFMLQPSSISHVCWNLCALLLIFYDLVTVPLEIFNPPATDFLFAMLLITSLFWTFDIILTFMTGHMSRDGMVSMKPGFVAMKYACTWLPVDTCLVICNWVSLFFDERSDKSGTEGLDVWRTLTLFRVLRILRVMKAPEMEAYLTEHVQSEIARLFVSISRLIILLIVVAHVIACAWYGVGNYIANQGNDTSWVARSKLEEQSVGDKYTSAMHWSLSQFTGENVIEIMNVVERTFAIVIFVFAFLFSTIFVSSITTLMTRLQIIASKQSGQLSVLRRYLHLNNISTSLAARVLRNAQHALKSNQQTISEHSVELLQEISEPLQVELHFELHFPVLESHPFFKQYNPVNPAGIRKVCHQAVDLFWCSAHDIVFSDGETPERPAMFFVVTGDLLYVQEIVDVTSRQLTRGHWVCELVLWAATGGQHMGTLSAVTESSLLLLDAHKFQRIVRYFPTDHPGEYAKAYVLEINMNEDSFSDVADVDVSELCARIFQKKEA